MHFLPKLWPMCFNRDKIVSRLCKVQLLVLKICKIKFICLGNFILVWPVELQHRITKHKILIWMYFPDSFLKNKMALWRRPFFYAGEIKYNYLACHYNIIYPIKTQSLLTELFIVVFGVYMTNENAAVQRTFTVCKL